MATTTVEADGTQPVERRSAIHRGLDRLGRLPMWAAALCLVLLYITVGLLGDVRVGSNNDAGGKLATIRAMADRSSCAPDIGYWAEDDDPEGDLHPIDLTYPTGDQWVQATSIPFQCAGMVLYEAGGIWGVLSLSMAGAVLAAAAAARIATAIGGERTAGTAAFWAVGALGPAGFYALDVWEHALGLGLMLAGIALVLEREDALSALVTGAVIALAITVRAEMALYAVVIAAAILLSRPERRRWLARPGSVLAGVVGGAAVLAGNTALERAVLHASLRGSRASSAANKAGSEVGDRVRDAALTAVGVFPDDRPIALVCGAGIIAALVGLMWWGLHRRGAPPLAAVAAGSMLVTRVLPGLGFVPGFLAAAPISAAGLVGAAPGRPRVLRRIAIGVLPLVWLLQWRGNLVAQWGGRYVLTSGVLLTVIGCVALASQGWRGAHTTVALGLACLIGVYGFAWRIERTNIVAHGLEVALDTPADAIILQTDGALSREVGASYGDRRALLAQDPEQVALAAEIIERSGAADVTVVQLDFDHQDLTPVSFAGYRATHTIRTRYLADGQVVITRYRLEP